MPLLALLIQELPGILGFIKGLHHEQAPTEPQPTDAEVLAALHAAVQSSLATDAQWLAAHPPTP